jgi:hypothetical protein
MTDRIEAALRTRPSDEPDYLGNIADLLGDAEPVAAEPSPRPTLVNLTDHPRAKTRRRATVVTIAVAAACVAVLALVSTVRAPSRPPAESTPTTTPTTSARPPIAPSLSSLDGRWVGRSPSSIDGSGSSPAFLVFGDGSVALERSVGGIVTDYGSDLAEVPDGRFRATLTVDIGSCAPASTGDFTWALSPGQSVLTIGLVDDDCAPRGDAFSGTWTRVSCPTRGSDCLGALEAGRHDSVSFDPFGTGSYGQVSYEVPAGWSSPLDDRARLALETDGSGTTGPHGMYFFADVAAPSDACSTTPALQTGADAIAAALSDSLEGAGASATANATTVGGFPARVVDISSDGTSPCGSDPVSLLVARADSPIAWTVTTGTSPRSRIVLVDLPEGRTMAVVVATDGSDDEYEALLDTASTVIDSLVVSRTP